MFCTLIEVLVTQGCIFVKTLQTLLLRSVHFIEWKLYLKVGERMTPGSGEEIGLRLSGYSTRQGPQNREGAWMRGILRRRRGQDGEGAPD